MSGSLATDLNSQKKGLTAIDYRHILQGLYGVPGIVSGGTVTGNSSLTYHVAATVAVIDRGSDGTRLAYYPGGDTAAVKAGDASNKRIDVIWMKADDPGLDGDSVDVVVGVTQGTPAANPAVPALQSGQLPLMEKLVQPGTTNLSTGSGDNRNYNYAIPYGCSLGLMGENWDKMDGAGDPTIKKHYYEQQIAFSLPTDRLLEFDFDTNFSASDLKLSEWAMQFRVDGKALAHSGANFAAHDTSWTSFHHSYTATVPKGTHTADIDSWLQFGSKVNFHYNGDTDHDPVWVGRRFQIWDRGVAQ